jgi:uncharacterized membrane protein YheB (UPF0754 family)
MVTDQEFKNAVTKILINNFGISTAKMFEHNFLYKSKEEIIASLEKLLVEFIGKENTQKQLENILF